MTPSSAPVSTRRPAAEEHHEYYGTYIALVPDGDVIDVMRGQLADVESLLGPVPSARGAWAYAPGKWTLNEVVGHLIDTERVFAYRATAFSRRDPNPLPSFDQDTWVPCGHYSTRTMRSLLDEWADVRRATIALAAHLPDEAWDYIGTASGRPFTTRACIWIVPGHTAYHLREIRTRYLP
jgi:hypothetical protein